MGFYKSKPIIIEARQMPKTKDVRKTKAAMEIYDWVAENGFEYECYNLGLPTEYKSRMHNLEKGLCGVTIDDHGRMLIMTLEGEMEVSPGDYVIRGLKGEFYPCKPDIFEAKYNLVGNSEANFRPVINAQMK